MNHISKVRSKLRGFTLIELLIVIAIIAILTGIVMTNFSSTRARARDAKRVSDVGHIQLALELYFDRCRQYPNTLTMNQTSQQPNNGCPSGIWLGNYITKIPTPPLTGDTYSYTVKTSDYTDYFLQTALESSNDIIKDSLYYRPSWYSGTWTCSNNPAQKQYCVGPK